MYSILKVRIDQGKIHGCQKNRKDKNYLASSNKLKKELQKTLQDKMLNREIRISLYVKKLFGMKKKKEWYLRDGTKL